MKKSMLASLVGLLLASTAAYASQCPVDMQAIDAALAAGPELDSQQLEEVKKLRASGEELHKSGKHSDSVATLAKAKEILGVE